MTEPTQPTPQKTQGQMIADEITLLRGEIKELQDVQVSMDDLNAFYGEFRKLANYTNATSKKSMEEFNATVGGFIRSHAQQVSQAFKNSNEAMTAATKQLVASVSESMDERLEVMEKAVDHGRRTTAHAELIAKQIEDSGDKRAREAAEWAYNAHRKQFRWFGVVCALMLVIGALCGSLWGSLRVEQTHRELDLKAAGDELRGGSISYCRSMDGKIHTSSDGQRLCYFNMKNGSAAPDSSDQPEELKPADPAPE